LIFNPLPMTSHSKKISSLMDAVMDGIAILKLDKTKVSQVAHDEKATIWAFVILVLPVLINVVLAALQTTLFLSLQIKFLIIPLVTIFAVIFLMSFVAQQVFHAKGDHMAFFRVLAHAGVVTWLTVIPFVLSLLGLVDVYSVFNMANMVAGIWMFVVTYNVLQDYYKLNQQNTIITMVLGVVGAAIVQSILGRVLIGKFYRLMY
jgi:hypothetical protein